MILLPGPKFDPWSGNQDPVSHAVCPQILNKYINKYHSLVFPFFELLMEGVIQLVFFGVWLRLITIHVHDSYVQAHAIVCSCGLFILFVNSIPLYKYACSVTQLCPTLCDLMDGSPPGSSVHGLFQARILNWVAISYFRGPSRPRDETHTLFYPAEVLMTVWGFPVGATVNNTTFNVLVQVF